MGFIRVASAAVLLAVLGVVPSLHAQSPEQGVLQDTEARGLFLAGSSAYDQGRYQDALKYFQDAYKLSQRPGLLFNIGQVADRLRQDKLAIDSFVAYLEAFPEAPNRAEVENRLRALREAVAANQSAPPVAEPEPTPEPEPEPEAQPIPTPEEAALAAEPASSTPDSAADEEGGITGKWWFWTALGVVAASAAVGVALAVGGGEEDPEPLPPSTGVTVRALR